LSENKDNSEEKKDKEKLKRSEDFMNEDDEDYYELLEENI
jgi:hypothetical protein